MDNQPSARRPMRRSTGTGRTPPSPEPGPIQSGMGAAAEAVGAPHSAPTPIEVDRLSGPEQAQQVDLLVAASAAGVEVLTEGFVFFGARADTDAEAPATAAQEIDLGGLLGQ